MHIHARSLKYFDMIRRCGSIREAARQLHVASSAVNRQLLQLEGTAGTPLFERLPAGLRLTPAGEIFARHVVTVLQDAQRMAGELDALNQLRRGTLDIISAEGLSSDFLLNVLTLMTTRYPLVRITARSADGPAQMLDAVTGGDADIAIGFAFEHPQAVRRLAGGHFRLGAVVPPQHPLAASHEVSFSTCARHPLIIANARLSIHAALKELMARHRGPLNVIAETGSIELMKGLASRGLGVAFQTRLGLEREMRERVLVHVPLRVPARMNADLGVFVRAARVLPPALDSFIGIVGEEIRRREAEER